MAAKVQMAGLTLSASLYDVRGLSLCQTHGRAEGCRYHGGRRRLGRLARILLRRLKRQASRTLLSGEMKAFLIQVIVLEDGCAKGLTRRRRFESESGTTTTLSAGEEKKRVESYTFCNRLLRCCQPTRARTSCCVEVLTGG